MWIRDFCSQVASRLRNRFLFSSVGQHHLSVREWDESKRVSDLVCGVPEGLGQVPPKIGILSIELVNRGKY